MTLITITINKIIKQLTDNINNKTITTIITTIKIPTNKNNNNNYSK